MMVLVQMDFPRHPQRTPRIFSGFQAVEADPKWKMGEISNGILRYFHNLGPGVQQNGNQSWTATTAWSSFKCIFVVLDLDLYKYMIFSRSN